MKNEATNEKESVLDNAQNDEQVKEMIGKEYNGIVITIEDAQELGYDLFIKWLRTITKYGNLKRNVILIDRDDRIVAKFYTQDYEYSIQVRLPDDKDKGYLGCSANCRKSRPGEVWHRGSDLPDGQYNKETFDKIIRGVVSFEIKFLQCFKGE